MIGLGSNRLTVCRRGGMSVTQAGRGGMEWLAGSRAPLWASPYSHQATAALQRNFPSYWNDIRQYGFRNPNMVPWINEDPMLICSVVEVGVKRYLYFENGGSMAMPRLLTTDDTIEYSCFGEFRIFGRTGGVGTPGFAIRHMIGSENIYAIQQYVSWSSVYSPINAITEYHCTLDMPTKKFYIEGVSGSRNFNWSGLQSICNISSVSSVRCKLRFLNISELHYIPFVSETRDGLLDTASFTLNPNTTTSKFSAYYSDAQGNPWSPS